jgi:AcrR family transcriptional regulator
MTGVPAPRLDRRTRSARAEGRDGREALLEAALQVFAERGYRDASVDEVAERAGYSKGALYWHFSSKAELFLALVDERIDRPWREGIALLESASSELDMAPEASRRFAEMLGGQRELLLLEHEFWSLAARDPKLRARYAKRQRAMRTALGRAIAARMEHLGAPPLEEEPADLATAFIALGQGLAIQKLIDSRAVPDSLLGDTFALVYAGHLARSQMRPSRKKA